MIHYRSVTEEYFAETQFADADGRARRRLVPRFSLCVHPYWASSDAYECSLVTFKNYFGVRIKAGERYPK